MISSIATSVARSLTILRKWSESGSKEIYTAMLMNGFVLKTINSTLPVSA